MEVALYIENHKLTAWKHIFTIHIVRTSQPRRFIAIFYVFRKKSEAISVIGSLYNHWNQSYFYQVNGVLYTCILIFGYCFNVFYVVYHNSPLQCYVIELSTNLQTSELQVSESVPHIGDQILGNYIRTLVKIARDRCQIYQRMFVLSVSHDTIICVNVIQSSHYRCFQLIQKYPHKIPQWTVLSVCYVFLCA